MLNPVSGLLTSSTYQVKVRYNTVKVSAPTLPAGARTKLAKGRPVTVPVKVTNTGVAPLAYFADGRLAKVGTLQLTNLNSDDTFALPQAADVTPGWLVPTHASQFAVTAAGTQPVNVDVFWSGGNPDHYAAAPAAGATTVNFATGAAAGLSQGFYYADLGQTGPFGEDPAPAGKVTVSAFASGQLFDTAVTSSTGDVWSEGVAGQSGTSPLDLRAIAARVHAAEQGDATPADQAAAQADGPLVLAPGQTGTIMVTITPDQAEGQPGHRPPVHRHLRRLQRRR